GTRTPPLAVSTRRIAVLVAESGRFAARFLTQNAERWAERWAVGVGGGGGRWAAGGRFAAVDEVDGAGDANAVDDLLARLGRWREDQDAAEAARSRTRERWLRQQAAEAARLSAVALDLAERGTPVTVSTTAG